MTFLPYMKNGRNIKIFRFQAGLLIDSNQCVFRMNAAETSAQFKKDVGSKTTFRLLSKDGFSEYRDLFWRDQYVRDQNPYLLIWDGLLRPPRMDRVSMQIDQFINNVSSSLDLLFPPPASREKARVSKHAVIWQCFFSCFKPKFRNEDTEIVLLGR